MLRHMRGKGSRTLLLLGFVVSLAACGGTDRDEAPPELTLDTTGLQFLRQEPTIDLTGTIETGAELQVGVEGSAVVTGQTVAGTVWSAQLTDLQEGNNAVVLTAVDDYGNLTNIRFSIVLDTTPPTAVPTSPVDGAAAVPVTSQIAVTFSEALDPASVTGNITLLDSNGQAVAGTVELRAGALTATFVPAAALAAGTELYRVPGRRNYRPRRPAAGGRKSYPLDVHHGALAAGGSFLRHRIVFPVCR